MSTKHTPGPWTNERSGNYWSILGPDRNLHGDGVTSSPVAAIVQTSPEAQANAALIAAAPDMLRALKAITNDAREILAGREPIGMDMMGAIVNGMAANAIARAEGR